MFAFNHGDEVRHTVTGLLGIIMARTEWFNGCRRYCVQPAIIEKGVPVDSCIFDEGELELVCAEKIKTFRSALEDAEDHAPGGPMNDEISLPS